MRWPLIIVALGVSACGGEIHSQADATTVDGETSDVSDDALIDASMIDGTSADAVTEKQWPIVYNIVDGGGDSPDCYPDGDIMQACCNGQPCRGFCLLDDDGSIECSCYGIPGGCIGENGGIPNVCCSAGRGCVEATACVTGPPQH